MKFQIITNNPLVVEKYSSEYDVVFLDISIQQIMEHARNMCLEGYELLTHPLSGSVKPGETPYKSIMMSSHKGSVDASGCKLAQTAIEACEKFKHQDKYRDPGALEDFQLIDCTLISSGIESAIA
jgi:hypothetical protein